jgi:predicted esterase YcpF (UPF0227 family)
MTQMTDFLYLHGFNSSPESLKARETSNWLQQHMPSARFHAPALSPHPEEALRQAESLLRTLPEDTVLIGSSLGGFYASWLAATMGRKAVLINPAVQAHIDLLRLPREQLHPYSGEVYSLTDDDARALEAHQVSTPDPARYWLVLGSQDEVLDWRIAARHFQGSKMTIFSGDNHRLQRWTECLPSLPAFAGCSV